MRSCCSVRSSVHVAHGHLNVAEAGVERLSQFAHRVLVVCQRLHCEVVVVVGVDRVLKGRNLPAVVILASVAIAIPAAHHAHPDKICEGIVSRATHAAAVNQRSKKRIIAAASAAVVTNYFLCIHIFVIFKDSPQHRGLMQR